MLQHLLKTLATFTIAVHLLYSPPQGASAHVYLIGPETYGHVTHSTYLGVGVFTNQTMNNSLKRTYQTTIYYELYIIAQQLQNNVARNDEQMPEPPHYKPCHILTVVEGTQH